MDQIANHVEQDDESKAANSTHQAAREDGLGAGATLATEERAGDLAGRVRPLLDVDRQREEVELLLRVLAGPGGDSSIVSPSR